LRLPYLSAKVEVENTAMTQPYEPEINADGTSATFRNATPPALFTWYNSVVDAVANAANFGSENCTCQKIKNALSEAGFGEDVPDVRSHIGSIFPGLGSLLGASGVVAQSAYDRATSAQSAGDIASQRPVSVPRFSADVGSPLNDGSGESSGDPSGNPGSRVTIGQAVIEGPEVSPGQAAHDAGIAAAHGTARIIAGQVPPPKGDLSEPAETARVIAHGLEGAPPAVKRAVLGGLPASAAPGLARANSEMGGDLVGLLIFGAFAAFVGYKLFKVALDEDAHTGRNRLLY
jgi:hypothetical protein